MLSLRSSVATLLLVLAPVGLVAGCGESDVQRKAREANDAVTTSPEELARQQTQQDLAEENAKLAERDAKDRKGLAKDVVDAVGGSSEEAKRNAEKRAADAQKAAKDAADGVFADAQDEAERIREEAQDAIDEARGDIEDAVGSTP